MSKDCPVNGTLSSKEPDVLTAAQVEELKAQGRAVTFLDYLTGDMRAPMILPYEKCEKYRRLTTLQIGQDGELETFRLIVAYSPPGSPAVHNWDKRMAATRAAMTTFQYLCKKVGVDEAQQIFREIAGARPKIDTANCSLLTDYISDPDQLPRLLSKFSKTRPEFFRQIYGRAPTGIKEISSSACLVSGHLRKRLRICES